MSDSRVTFFANFWPKAFQMPSIEEQYSELWRLAKVFRVIGIPLDVWHPPADTPANSRLNRSFDEAGVTPAALALAKADQSKHSNIRFLDAWNGVEDEGGMFFGTKFSEGPFPCNVEVASELEPLRTFDNALLVAKTILEWWSPVMLLVGFHEYKIKKVFPDRPPVGWMIFLPFTIERNQVPEAAALIPIEDAGGKRRGTLIVSVVGPFDTANDEHVRRANAIEIRLVDQGLLPRFGDFLKMR